MTRHEFSKLCDGASRMLATLVQQTDGLAFPDETVVFDRSAVPETIAVLAQVISAIAETAK